MKYLLPLLAALALTLTGCNRRPPVGKVVVLPDQPVIITQTTTGKRPRVYWRYEVPLPSGRSLPVYGDNSAYVQRRYRYRLTPGQVVQRTVVLFTSDEGIHAADIDFKDFSYHR